MPYRRLAPDLAQWTVQALTRLTATYAVVQGAGIIIGGPDRWGSRALRVALSVPGAPASWGWALLGLGILTLALTFYNRHRLVLVSMFGIATWSMFFAVSLTPSVLEQGSRVATTGPLTYGFIAVAACVLGVAYRQSGPR